MFYVISDNITYTLVKYIKFYIWNYAWQTSDHILFNGNNGNNSKNNNNNNNKDNNSNIQKVTFDRKHTQKHHIENKSLIHHTTWIAPSVPILKQVGEKEVWNFEISTFQETSLHWCITMSSSKVVRTLQHTDKDVADSEQAFSVGVGLQWHS